MASRTPPFGDVTPPADLGPPPGVLLVDAHEPRRRRLAEALRGWGFLVSDHARGAAALGAARSRAPDVLICDLELADMPGLELARAVRDAPATADTPILLLTAEDDPALRRDAFAAGADCSLPRDATPEELLAAAWSLARRGSRLREVEEAEQVVDALADLLESRGIVSRRHMLRTARLAEAFGRLLGLAPDALQVLHRAGFLHDVGLLAIDDRILHKPGPLTDHELAAVQMHGTTGAQICARFRCLEPVVPILLHHHEHWDGTGYPEGLIADEIPYLARVFQLADVYESLTSEQPWRPAYSRADAVAVLRRETAGGFWDPQLAARFLEWLEAGLFDEVLVPARRSALN